MTPNPINALKITIYNKKNTPQIQLYIFKYPKKRKTELQKSIFFKTK